MSDITKATPENLFGNYTASKNVSVSPSIQNASHKIGDTVGVHLAGSESFLGLIVLTVFGFALWRSNASMDVSAGVLFPTTFFLAVNGYMPLAHGVIDAAILAAAATFSFGLLKYITR